MLARVARKPVRAAVVLAQRSVFSLPALNYPVEEGLLPAINARGVLCLVFLSRAARAWLLSNGVLATGLDLHYNKVGTRLLSLRCLRYAFASQVSLVVCVCVCMSCSTTRRT